MSKSKVLPVRGFLMHITHYDPKWIERKPREKPFDLGLGLEVVDAMADAGMNTLVIDCADGVKYKSHPEMARHYTVPMRTLARLAGHARERGLDVVPKLNFSSSHQHMHSRWMRPWMAPLEGGWKWGDVPCDLIDELIPVCQPKKYFHIGMDEDHDRSHQQYVDTITELCKRLRKRKLRPVVWNDSSLRWPDQQAFAEKARLAEPHLPKGVVETLWNYSTTDLACLRRLIAGGFEVWAAPGGEPDKVRECRDALLQHGGKGILLTKWIPTRPKSRRTLLGLIQTCGPLCSGG